MPIFFNGEWLNQNGQRAYPLTDTASKTDTTGTITLPDSFIVALYFPVNAGQDVDATNFYLQSVLFSGTGYNIAIGYDDGSPAPPIVAAVNIAVSTHTENMSYALAGINNFADSSGMIAIGILDDVSALPPGQYTFSPAAGQLEPDAIRPQIRGITSITLVNGTDSSAPLYGDIELVAGTNMRLTPVIQAGSNPQIVFSAISGEGLNEDCVCDQNELGPPIITINGIQPQPDGNFNLAGDQCLTLSPIANGLQLTDECSQPCCGCTELDAINQQLSLFGTALTSLTNTVMQLNGEVTQMSLVVLGSRLSDQGCTICG